MPENKFWCLYNCLMGSTVNKILGFNSVNKDSQSYTKIVSEKRNKTTTKSLPSEAGFYFLHYIALGSIVMQQAFWAFCMNYTDEYTVYSKW